MSDPSEWTVQPLNSVAAITMGQSPPASTVRELGANFRLPFLQGNAEFGEVHPSPKYACTVPLRRCRTNDALISVRAPVGATNKADQAYCIGRGLAAISFTGVDRHFGWHALLHAAPKLRVVAQGTTFEAIGKKELACLQLIFPFDSMEQRRIAEILDTLDEAIRASERLIAKLEKVKQGLLHDLMTQGIDEDGRLRDPVKHPEQFARSSTGLLPTIWDLQSCNKVFRLASGKAKTQQDLESERPGPIPVYGGNGVTGHTHTAISSGPTIVIGRVGEYCGTAYLVTVPAWITDNALWTTSWSPGWSIDFVFHYLEWFDLRTTQSRTGQPLVTQSSIAKVLIPQPPLHEQAAIARVVDDANVRLGREFDCLEKFRALKQGLMDDLLTGRVHVKIDDKDAA